MNNEEEEKQEDVTEDVCCCVPVWRVLCVAGGACVACACAVAALLCFSPPDFQQPTAVLAAVDRRPTDRRTAVGRSSAVGRSGTRLARSYTVHCTQ